MKLPVKYRILKITGIILLLLLVTGGGVYFYLIQHYKKMLRHKLPAIAATATDSLYRITAADFSINIFRSSFSIIGVHMQPDTAVLNKRRREGHGPHVLLDITVPEVEISGLIWKKIKASKEVVCSDVGIYQPKISIIITDDHSAKIAAAEKEPAIKRVFADHISITDPEISYRKGSGKAAFSVRASGGDITATGWDYHPQQRADSTRFFYARSADVQLHNIVYMKPGSLYTFGLDTLHFISDNHDLLCRGIYVRPVVSKEVFYQSVKQQKEIYEGAFRSIRFNSFNWEQFISKQFIGAASIDLEHPDLEIFFSRLPPPNTVNKTGNYPHQLLQQLQLPIHIPVVHINEGSFRYTELNERTHRTGTLDFRYIDGRITNITNQPGAIKANPHCYIELNGKFMHRSDIRATFDLLLSGKSGRFNVEGQLKDLDARQVTDAAKALALAQIKSLKLHQLDFNITGNDTAADGKFSIIYNDLKVKLQKVDEATKAMHSRGFLSLLANELLLYNDNPMDGEPLRVAITHVTRDTTKSFFNLIWRNFFDAGLQTAIRQEGMADLVKKKKAKQGKEKVHFFRRLFPKKNRNKTTGMLFPEPVSHRRPLLLYSLQCQTGDRPAPVHRQQHFYS